MAVHPAGRTPPQPVGLATNDGELPPTRAVGYGHHSPDGHECPQSLAAGKDSISAAVWSRSRAVLSVAGPHRPVRSCATAAARPIVGPLDQRRRPSGRASYSAAVSTRCRARATSRSGQDGPCTDRSAQSRRAGVNTGELALRVKPRRRPRPRGMETGSDGAVVAGSRTTDSRKGRVGEHHPPPSVRETGNAGCRAGVGGQQWSSRTPGPEGVHSTWSTDAADPPSLMRPRDPCC